MATHKPKITKTGYKAPVYGYCDTQGVWCYAPASAPIYLSSTNAQIIRIQGVWVKVKKNRTRRGSTPMQYDLRKPYTFSTRTYRTQAEKTADKKVDRAAAMKRARKLLSKKDLKALGLVK